MESNLILWGSLAILVLIIGVFALLVRAHQSRASHAQVYLRSLEQTIRDQEAHQAQHRHLVLAILSSFEQGLGGLRASYDVSRAWQMTPELHRETERIFHSLAQNISTAHECQDAALVASQASILTQDIGNPLASVCRAWGQSLIYCPIPRPVKLNPHAPASAQISAYAFKHAFLRLFDYMAGLNIYSALEVRVQTTHRDITIYIDSDNQTTPGIEDPLAEVWLWIARAYLAQMGGRIEMDPVRVILPLAPTSNCSEAYDDLPSFALSPAQD